MIALNLRDLDGKPFNAESLKGSIVVLDFWATWCKPCITEIPKLNEMHEKFAAKGVKVIGVTIVSGGHTEVKPFVATQNMKYTVLMGDDGQGYDLNIYGYPTTFLVTKDWKVHGVYPGAPPGKIEKITEEIEKLLGSDE
jgi:thiol-disulfide isomerase/thioredoxin